MSSFQKFIAAGNLGGDPEIRQVGEKSVAKFRLAISEPWRKKTQWFSCEYWRGGKVLGYMSKGSAILIEGTLDNQEWEKDGQRKTQVVIKVDNITLLGGRQGNDEDGERQTGGGSGSSPDEFDF